MESLNKIKDLVEKISIDTQKVFKNGNHSAAIRARKNAQELKLLVPQYRKELLGEIKRFDTGRIKRKVKSNINDRI